MPDQTNEPPSAKTGDATRHPELPRRMVLGALQAAVAWAGARTLSACGFEAETSSGGPAGEEDSAAHSFLPAQETLRCARPTTFQPVVDDAPRTSFRQTRDSTTFDWLTIELGMASQLALLPDRILDLLRQLGNLQLGYPINLLDHSLQAGTRARLAGASDDLVLAALCHRLGMAFGVEGYAELSAAILRGYVSDDAYQIVRHHAEYAPQRSAAGSDLRARYAAQPWHADAVRFNDEWLTPSFDPNYPSFPLSAFEPLVRAWFGVIINDPYKTRNDCIPAGAP